MLFAPKIAKSGDGIMPNPENRPKLAFGQALESRKSGSCHITMQKHLSLLHTFQTTYIVTETASVIRRTNGNDDSNELRTHFELYRQ
jgi:hypothetical protein